METISEIVSRSIAGAGRSRLVAVLGMHRCGTSALTRGLKALGVDLGSNLMPPLVGINDKGFWEDADLNVLNVEMLQALGSDWHHLAAPEAGFLDFLRNKGFHLRAVDLLRQKIGDARCFGFKDPRIAQLLPFWKEVFSHCELNVCYVLAIRNPISVVRSLEHRDQFDLEKTVLLWLSHTVRMLDGTYGSGHRVVIDYDRLIEAPEREMQRIGVAFGLKIDAEQMQEYCSEFIDRRLRHTIYGTGDLALDGCTATLTQELYRLLLAVASDEIGVNSAEVQREVERAKRQLAAWEYPLKLMDKLYAAKQSVQRSLAEFEKKACDSSLDLEAAQKTINALRVEVSERDLQVNSLGATATERSAQIAGLHAAAAMRDQKIDDLTRINVENEHRVAALLRSGEERDAELFRAREEKGVLQGEVDERKRESEDLKRQLELRVESIDQANRLIREAAATRDQQIAEWSRLKVEHENRAVDLIRSIEERDTEVTRLKADLGVLKNETDERKRESDGRIAALETERAVRIAEQTALLSARNHRISGLELMLDARERKIQFLLSLMNVNSIDRSAPTKDRELGEILARDGSQFIESAFLTTQGRMPNTVERERVAGQLRTGMTKLQILGELLDADGAHNLSVRIPGLRRAVFFQRIAKMPFIGLLIPKGSLIERDSAIDRRIRAIQQQLTTVSSRSETQFEHLCGEIDSLRQYLTRSQGDG